MTDLHELKKQIDWLQDKLSAATNVDGELEDIDRALRDIESDLSRFIEAIDRNTDEIGRLFDAYSTIAVQINQHTEALKKLLVEVLTSKPPAASDMLGEFFAKVITNNFKARAAKPKPRKTKLSVVSKDGNDGPGGAP
jgi:hypothetical protein